MGIRERYDNGVFSWIDLSTTDPEAAKHFYSELFNWSFVDLPIPDGTPYSMASKNGHNVAALFLMPAAMIAQEIRPHWQTYITVDNLDETLATCEQQGGEIVMPPIDVLDSGQMAVVKDPTGAIANLWQANNHIGAGLVNEPNTFCWAELQTRGAERAIAFYQSVFHWEIMIDEKPPNYATCSVNGHLNCGIFDMDKIQLSEDIPCRWAVYFNVENFDTSLEQVKQLNGTVIMDPVVIAPGRFAVIADPQGAVFTLMQVNTPDA
jgi:hypothetical protein